MKAEKKYFVCWRVKITGKTGSGSSLRPLSHEAATSRASEGNKINPDTDHWVGEVGKDNFAPEHQHDHEWVDDSFDHEFGVEVCGHWECACGDTNCDSEPPTSPNYEDDFTL